MQHKVEFWLWALIVGLYSETLAKKLAPLMTYMAEHGKKTAVNLLTGEISASAPGDMGCGTAKDNQFLLLGDCRKFIQSFMNNPMQFRAIPNLEENLVRAANSLLAITPKLTPEPKTQLDENDDGFCFIEPQADNEAASWYSLWPAAVISVLALGMMAYFYVQKNSPQPRTEENKPNEKDLALVVYAPPKARQDDSPDNDDNDSVADDSSDINALAVDESSRKSNGAHAIVSSNRELSQHSSLDVEVSSIRSDLSNFSDEAINRTSSVDSVYSAEQKIMQIANTLQGGRACQKTKAAMIVSALTDLSNVNGCIEKALSHAKDKSKEEKALFDALNHKRHFPYLSFFKQNGRLTISRDAKSLIQAKIILKP